MAYDFALPTTCNHRISRELSALRDDLRSLRVTQPMSSTMTTQVYASDDLVPMKDYDIINDPTSLAVNTPKMVYFKYKWKSPGDFFEVSYTTFNETCPKCIGIGVLHDVGYSPLGTIAMSRNENLLLQNVEKFTITESGSNPFHTYIGTNLVSLLGERILDINFLKGKITQEIMTSIDKFKELQDKYVASGRTLTDGETLEKVDSINVTQDSNDPTILRVDVEATAASGQSLRYVQLLKLS